jgi:protein involved in polysaccharide export with SLBB domain
MNPGEGRSSWRDRPCRRWAPAGLLLGALLLCAGCATDRANVARALMSGGIRAQRAQEVADSYQVHCPDVIDVGIRQRPELSGKYVIEATGRIDLGDYGSLRVEGRTPPQLAGILAQETGQLPDDVLVRVAAFRSQYVFLTGQVAGWQRTVPYQGQETVLELLQRVGGITPAAELRDVYVVRTHLEQNQRPEVFHVDLQAIVLKRDEKTNMRLLPFDQIHVGESRQSQLEKSFPPWLRPIYQVLWDILPNADRLPASPQAAPAPRSVADATSS